jgi:hypothetical protein
LEVPLYHLTDWSPGASEPAGLPGIPQKNATGKPVMMTLVPYGSTHLRLTTLPMVDASAKN